MSTHRPHPRFMLAAALAALTACGSTQTPPPASPPPPAPAPAPAPEAMSMPMPAPAPQPADPAAAQRAQVVGLLDQIDAQLAECETNRMQHVGPQARRVQDLVAQMAEPIAAFPRAAEPYAQLQSHAPRFTEACRRNQHRDMHEHHQHLRQAAAAVRAAL